MLRKLLYFLFAILLLLSFESAIFFYNSPPDPPVIDGPTSCCVGKEYNFTFSAVDYDGDDLFFIIHWGDGFVVNWIGPYKSGEKINLPRCYSSLSGECFISARAMDVHGALSEWGTYPLKVNKNQFREDLRCGLSNGATPGRSADLVIDHPQFLALFGEAQDGEHEVVPARTVDPAGAKNEVRDTHSLNCPLARQLGLAVDI